MKKIESSLKRTTDLNKYQSKDEDKEENRYFDYFIIPSFKGVNRLIVLSFKNSADRELHTKH